MSLPRFFTRDIEDDHLLLDEGESGHAVRVLRLREGDEIVVLDGEGGRYRAVIAEARSRRVRARIVEKETRRARAPWHLHIAIAPTKSFDRFSFFLEKAAEAGIDEITPLLCDHSERKTLRHDRAAKVLIAAMKQSGQSFLPRLHPLMPLAAFLEQPRDGDLLIAHCCEQQDERIHLYDALEKKKVTILIGPEGDFSPAEVARARRAGYRSISLGNTRLRTETAGITAAIITATKFRHEGNEPD